MCTAKKERETAYCPVSRLNPFPEYGIVKTVRGVGLTDGYPASVALSGFPIKSEGRWYIGNNACFNNALHNLRDYQRNKKQVAVTPSKADGYL